MLLYPNNPTTVLAKYFDPMLYPATWGTKQLVCRFHRSRVDVETLTPYCSLDVITVSLIKNAVLLDICLDEAGGESKIAGEGHLGPQVPAHRQTFTAP
jgi:hypothetical protein